MVRGIVQGGSKQSRVIPIVKEVTELTVLKHQIYVN